MDIVVRGPSYCLPVEVKYQNKAEIAKDAGIVSFCAAHGFANQAYFVTKMDFGTVRFPDIDTLFMKVPAHVLCYLLGQAERLHWGDPD